MSIVIVSNVYTVIRYKYKLVMFSLERCCFMNVPFLLHHVLFAGLVTGLAVVI